MAKPKHNNAGLQGKQPAAAASPRMCRRAAQSRLRNLIHNRIGAAQGMRAMLGDASWAHFVADVYHQHGPAFIACFQPGSIWCRGPISGGCCPHHGGPPAMCDIHCGHTVDLNNICSAWRQARRHLHSIGPPGAAATTAPQPTWHAGLKRQLLLHLLFGLGWGAVVFRCWRCHSKQPHYDHRATAAGLLQQGGSLGDPIVID